MVEQEHENIDNDMCWFDEVILLENLGPKTLCAARFVAQKKKPHDFFGMTARKDMPRPTWNLSVGWVDNLKP
jgi:hypothetical protein